jgi:hypothetical protein
VNAQAVATACAFTVAWLIAPWAGDRASVPASLLQVAVVGVVDLGVLAVLARLLRLGEVNEVVDLLTARLRRRRRGAHRA